MRFTKEEQRWIDSTYKSVVFLIKAANNSLKYGEIDERGIHWARKEIEDIVTELAQIIHDAEMRSINRQLKNNFKYHIPKRKSDRR